MEFMNLVQNIICFFLSICNNRFVTIQSYLREMREALISILGKFQIHFFLLPLGNWRMCIILVVEVLLHTRYFIMSFIFGFVLCF